jgi:enterochelin esterase-like enzyme
MQTEKSATLSVENYTLSSVHLNREVMLDVYLPMNILDLPDLSLLLINDGQNLIEMQFENILEDLYQNNFISALMCVGIHCGKDRKQEYGTIDVLDYKGRGTKAAAYSMFIFSELLPFIRQTYSRASFKEKAFCGFSLGALSALDIVWNNPQEFNKAGLFSGSLWWRTVSQDGISFDENKHRIMHMKIRNGSYYPWLKFFFETGTKDETADRNKNGIIDSIDDTLSLIDELVLKGYDRERDIKYLELKEGKHDIETWAKAFPEFLKWGWSK